MKSYQYFIVKVTDNTDTVVLKIQKKSCTSDPMPVIYFSMFTDIIIKNGLEVRA